MIFIPVLGAPRSGTSCVAGVLRELGVYFGEDDEMQPADENNTRGYNELAAAHFPNDALLKCLDPKATWFNPPHMKSRFDPMLNMIDPDIVAEHAPYAMPAIWFIVRSLDKRSFQRIYGLKDTRMVFTLCQWLTVIVHHHVRPVVVHRDPEAIIKSWVKAGWAIEPVANRILYRYQNWIKQILGSELNCYEIEYEELLGSPKETVRALYEWIYVTGLPDRQINVIDNALAYIDQGLNHFNPKQKENR